MSDIDSRNFVDFGGGGVLSCGASDGKEGVDLATEAVLFPMTCQSLHSDTLLPSSSEDAWIGCVHPAVVSEREWG